MGQPETSEFDESRVTDESRLFAEHLFGRFPEFRRYAAMERQPSETAWSLVVKIPAPSGDTRSDMVIWLNGGDEPSLGFGSWHTHENFWASGREGVTDRQEFLELIAGILADRYVICEDIGCIDGWRAAILDLRQRDALLEELTNKGASGRARVASWSGRLDREIDLKDLDSI